MRTSLEQALTEEDWATIEEARNQGAGATPSHALKLLRDGAGALVLGKNLYKEGEPEVNTWMRKMGLPYRLYSPGKEKNVWVKSWGITKITPEKTPGELSNEDLVEAIITDARNGARKNNPVSLALKQEILRRMQPI